MSRDVNLDVVILAAGKGTRMRSARPKVLHELAGRPLLHHVIGTAQTLEPRNIAVVVGHQAAEVREVTEAAFGEGLSWVEQREQRGTGHAVQHGMQVLPDDGVVLVLYGDVPLAGAATLETAAEAAAAGNVGLVVSHFDNPAELGRIVRDEAGNVIEIVEYRDASEDIRTIHEINSGICALPAAKLIPWLDQLQGNNVQGELYLTDVIGMAVRDGVRVLSIDAEEDEVTGINDRAQLAQLERVYQHREAQRLMAEGVTIADPARLDIRGAVSAGEDCFIDVNVVLQGDVKLGSGVTLGPGAVVTDTEIGDGTVIHPHTVIEGSVIGRNCQLGPFARVRPGSEFSDKAKIGNFVETKKAFLGPGSKASHLAYLGDTTLGADCNVGAGTITCNYDGINKHRTEIGDNVFVGTNATLVAPLEIEDGAYVAAGSVVTTKVEAGDLAVGRGRQRNIKGWKRPDQRK